MTTELAAKSHVYFDSSIDTSFIFGRSINRLLITVESGTVRISFDGGDNHMALAVGTHQLDVYQARIQFTGGGTFSGYGISL
jgi:hypothetical protein